MNIIEHDGTVLQETVFESPLRAANKFPGIKSDFVARRCCEAGESFSIDPEVFTGMLASLQRNVCRKARQPCHQPLADKIIYL